MAFGREKLPMLGFVPQPSLQGFLHSLWSVRTNRPADKQANLVGETMIEARCETGKVFAI